MVLSTWIEYFMGYVNLAIPTHEICAIDLEPDVLQFIYAWFKENLHTGISNWKNTDQEEVKCERIQYQKIESCVGQYAASVTFILVFRVPGRSSDTFSKDCFKKL